MQLEDFPVRLEPLPGAAPIWRGWTDAAQLRDCCERVRARGGQLLALWGSDERDLGRGFSLHVALTTQPGLAVLSLALDREHPVYADISAVFPAASRMQRATFDLLGLRADGGDQRKWLRHGAWREDRFPLRKDFHHSSEFTLEPFDAAAGLPYPPPETDMHHPDDYPFVSVAGEGVHEIPVGPIHAGIIEPGHFRFSAVGEKILRLEERLGYTHKGVEKRFETMRLEQGARLAGRISGDSTVAYAWGYAMAAEGATRTAPPERALWLRALCLERERVMNHLGDLGYLGNDVAFSFGFAQFWLLKEEMLRVNQAVFGHRYLMDYIVPGGVTHDLAEDGKLHLLAELTKHEKEVAILKGIYDDHAGVQDRFLATGRVNPDLAAKLGLGGLAGRASGQSWDLRAQHPCAPYDQLEVHMSTHRSGDVAARVTVRFEEVAESLRLMRQILALMPGGKIREPLETAPENAFGIGWVEGWRGQVLVALETGKGNAIRRLHPHDPSWQNWPLVEHAVIGNMVPDFPLINKSFNLSYSGVDL